MAAEIWVLKEDNMAKYQGSCACGAVHIETNADPIMAAHCQCSKCQKLSGAPHSSFAVFPADAVKVDGKLVDWSYTADSGNTATRGRCAVCGSPVVGRSSGMPNLMGIVLSALDNPSAIKPQMVTFTSKAASWDSFDASLPKFPGMPQM
jgi:hypothetical protein